MSIYVAASSNEIDRAEKWMAALRDEGIQVTSTWCENIRRVQQKLAMKSTNEAANPHKATDSDRRSWAMTNIKEVRSSRALWLLIPEPPHTSQGGYYEKAVAWMDNKRVIASGGDRRFIYTAMSDDLFSTDEEAFEALRERYKTAL